MEWAKPDSGTRETENRSKAGDLFAYIQEQGPNRISPTHPFGKLDALVLARVSYMSFEGLVLPVFTAGKRLREIGDKYIELCAEDDLRYVAGEDIRLMELIKDAPRYENLILTGYRASFSNAEREQFAAVTVVLPDRTAFVSYRGTDGSLNGWREDFDLGFLGILPSDRDAEAYLAEAMDTLSPYIRFRIGGHSKGGNLAAYAASVMPDEKKARIDEIWLFDSPGFRRDVFLGLPWKNLRGKVRLFVPSQSIVGMILYNIAPAECVQSRKSMFLQHDVYQWLVAGSDFVPALLENISLGIKSMSLDLFESMDNLALKEAVDGIFGYLKDDRGDHFGDLSKKVLRRSLSTLMLFRKMPAEKRQPFMAAFGRVSESMKLIGRSEQLRKDLAKKALKAKVKAAKLAAAVPAAADGKSAPAKTVPDGKPQAG